MIRVANLFNRLLFASVLSAGFIGALWVGQSCWMPAADTRKLPPALQPLSPATGPTLHEAIRGMGGDPAATIEDSEVVTPRKADRTDRGSQRP